MNNKDVFVVINKDKIDVKKGFKYEDNKFLVISNTILYDLKFNEIKLEEVIFLYEKNIELANVISNTFTVIIIDKKNNTLFCSQDLNGDTVPIYYYGNNDKIIITNKILNIIDQENFKINNRVIPYFIKKGYIQTEETLIEKIYKIVPNYNLTIDLKSNIYNFYKKSIKHYKLKNNDTDTYIDEFNKIINKKESNKKTFITLSNGHDSNFIYRFLDKEKSIEAFSIGGIAGVDETNAVKENIKKYNNTSLSISHVNENTLNNYPDIVYHLGGYMYEKGIFLQYELYKSMKNKNNEDVVLFSGEGADQVFSCEYYNKFISVLKNIKYFIRTLKNKNKNELNNLNVKGGLMYKFNSYDMLSNIIIKKNGILMNDANICCVHPYLYKNIVNIGYFNRKYNIRDKNSHIKACKKEIDKDIMKNINNTGGTTNPIALFKNCTYINEIENFVNKSKYNILKMFKDVSDDEYLDYLSKVLYLELFEYLYIDKSNNIEDKKNVSLYDFIQNKNILFDK